MRKRIVFVFLSIFFFTTVTYGIDAWIRINQLGYLPNSQKKAVLISESALEVKKFTIHDALTNKELASFNTVTNWGGFQFYHSTFILDFSTFQLQGAFYIKAGLVYSPTIFINKNVYLGSADLLLNFMRQQRCGYNPVLKAYCHQYDGYEVYGDENAKKSTTDNASYNPNTQEPGFMDMRGGWHDASNYLKYGTTTANAVYQLLFAYQMNPSVFQDTHNAAGQVGKNNIPDILDEAKWGLDWLVKMYPSEESLYHQIGNDPDHLLLGMPSEDQADYGWGPGTGRPVYRANGKPQGFFNYQNRSTGIASIAGKYASAFALGADLLEKFYPAFVDTLSVKAVEVYEYGKKNPGVCQSTPGKLPSFYEEENWVDDMELAAAQLYRMTYDGNYLNDAAAYGRMEPITPWMCSDTASHYQWFPFVNLGHYMLASVENPRYQTEFQMNMLNGIQRMKLRAAENPFKVGVPLITCSNNLVTALASQCKLYRTMTGDSTFLDIETALVDWLFGCNPWGTSMIVGLPKIGDTPTDPHSALWHNRHIPVSGGLVNGPVSKAIFDDTPGLHLSKEDKYDRFQTSWAVYHDDYLDYSTNEPTMDGTASLSYLLACKQQEGVPGKIADMNVYTRRGITRTDVTQKRISLVFTGNEFADGYNTIRSTLKRLNIKASFFFTADFYKNPDFASVIKGLQEDNHYLGANPNKRQLYSSSQSKDSVFVEKTDFLNSIKANYEEMEKFGIDKNQTPFILTPSEWYNDSISQWSKEVGLDMVNYTPGTISISDNTFPEMRNQYNSSAEIYNQIMEAAVNDGLNGSILLFHIGADKRRQDKLYSQLYDLLIDLSKAGYDFVDLYDATDLADRNNVIVTDKKRKRKN